MRTGKGIGWRRPVLGLLIALVIGFGIYRAASARARKNSEQKGSVPLSPVVLGQRVFVSHCAACHQLDGRGLPTVYPPLAGSEWVNGTDARIVRIVLNGLAGLTEVRGEKFNNLMPPLRATLDDEQVAHVLTFIRQAWGNAAGAVTPEKVAAIRKATTERGAPWSVAELLVHP